MKLTKFPIQLNNYIEEDELIYGNELIKRYILFFIPFFLYIYIRRLYFE